MVIEIDDLTRRRVTNIFKILKSPVKIYLFTTTMHCLYCNEVEGIVNIISSLSPLISVEKCTCSIDHPQARRFRIDKHPAIVIHGEKEFNIRYFGLPVGYEFGVVIDSIVAASTGMVKLPPNIVDLVKNISIPIHIQVFVTPTCPYCPSVAKTAYSFAVLNQNITADVIETTEFPELSRRYGVYAVPKTVVNDVVEFEGAVPTDIFLRHVMRATDLAGRRD
ncbi:MAG: thioredoxin family protein [Candidatus Methanomethylicia archaeon]